MKKSLFITALSIFLLSGCGETPTTTAEATTVDATTVVETTATAEDTTVEATTVDATTVEATTVETTTTETTTEESSVVVGDVVTSANLLPSDIPSSGSGYPEDQVITAADGVQYFISTVMKGNQATNSGVKTDCVQFKKGEGYLYSKNPFKGTLTLKLISKNTDYGNFTGVPTLYVGNAEHPTETKKEVTPTDEGDFITYTYTLDGEYITLADESNYALYISSFVLA